MRSILLFVHEMFEDLELWYPKLRLIEADFSVQVAGPARGTVYKGKHGYPCAADLSFDEVNPSNFAGLVIPGGYAPDKLRKIPDVLSIVRSMHEHKKTIAFICHAGWVPISAKIVKGKKVTSTLAIKDDLENAGAIWQDRESVIDGNLISSRSVEDLPEFCKALLKELK